MARLCLFVRAYVILLLFHFEQFNGHRTRKLPRLCFISAVRQLFRLINAFIYKIIFLTISNLAAETLILILFVLLLSAKYALCN